MNLLETLKHYFGYDSLRPGQQELMDGILQGKDVLGIMPTGAGKSLCYQVPALMLEGITLVISPLISLMSDQVKALNQAGVHLHQQFSDRKPDTRGTCLCSAGKIQNYLCGTGAAQYRAFSRLCILCRHFHGDSG